MKLLTATTLALSFVATTALADSHMAGDNEMMTSQDLAGMQGDLIRSSDITDGAIYTTDAASDEGWDTDAYWDEIGADWNRIGEIEDLVLSRNGKVIGIVAEVGGFLDIGDKEVLISVSDLNLSADGGDEDYAYVTRLSEEELEELPSVEEGFWD